MPILRIDRLTTPNFLQQPQELWVNQVSSFIVDSLTKNDRKRQENIFELIYTEKNFVNDIEYLYQVNISLLSA